MTDTTGAAIHIYGKNFGNFRIWNIDASGNMPYCLEDNDSAGGTEQNAHDITSFICGGAYVDGGYVNTAVNLLNEHFNGQTYGFLINGAQTESHVDNSVFYGEVPFAIHNTIGTPGQVQEMV